ncbi:TolC family protein [Zooshikella harenae]|uniref:TolC family protein n=1 Tax=Zooshikella harenae TaxID=2827238 RepID=A0ABS5Z7V2_9GAMM|nr:TolC family protein [Zooshikella harenae]MBU2710123.1 TolC family protein [Zooshikella harenae]
MKIIHGWMLFLGLLTLGGCVVTPEPINPEKTAQRVMNDIDQMFKEQIPVSGEVSLYEAMARAVKYNIDHRLKMLSQVVKNRELDLSKYDLLPRLAASAGYKHRDNENASNSFSVSRGVESLETSTSQDKELWTAQAQVVWNVLDFGVSYLRQQQHADKVLIAEEQRRKVVQNIVQEVRQAYWRVVAAQEIEQNLHSAIRDIENALNTARRMKTDGLQRPIQTLEYRRDLLKTYRGLLKKSDELALAKADLARLMNLSPGTYYRVMPMPRKESSFTFNVQQLTSLQLAALRYRPELREMDYNARIVEKEGTIAKLELLPGLSFTLGGYYDDNSFLLNQSWAEAGVQVSYDLVKLATIPDVNALQDSRNKLVNLQRRALSSAILAQMELAVRSYLIAKKDYELSLSATDIENQRYRQYRAQGDTGMTARLELTQAKADMLLASLDQHFQYAQMQSQFGLILNSIGIDPLPQVVASHNLPALTSTMKRYFQEQLPKQLQEVLVEAKTMNVASK